MLQTSVVDTFRKAKFTVLPRNLVPTTRVSRATEHVTKNLTPHCVPSRQKIYRCTVLNLPLCPVTALKLYLRLVPTTDDKPLFVSCAYSGSSLRLVCKDSSVILTREELLSPFRSKAFKATGQATHMAFLCRLYYLSLFSKLEQI